VAEAYGYALAWLEQRNLLDPTVAPELRWSDERVEAYAHDLVMRLRPATVKNRLLSLERAFAVLAPSSGQRLARVVEAWRYWRDGRKANRPKTLPARGTRARSYGQGRTGMAKPRERCLLPRRPADACRTSGLRKSNFAGIRTHSSAAANGERWLVYSGQETRTTSGGLFPERSYRSSSDTDHYRPLLAGRRYTGDRPWLSYATDHSGPFAAAQLAHHTRMLRPADQPHLFSLHCDIHRHP
jgi:hypothetical protein